MSGQIHQLTQLTCNMCGQPGCQPQTSTYFDKYSRETVTEATWRCHRCGNNFSNGEVSRVKENEKA